MCGKFPHNDAYFLELNTNKYGIFSAHLFFFFRSFFRVFHARKNWLSKELHFCFMWSLRLRFRVAFDFFFFLYFHSFQAICNNYIRVSVCVCVDATVCSFLKLGLGLGLCLLTEAAELSRLVGATKFSLDIVQWPKSKPQTQFFGNVFMSSRAGWKTVFRKPLQSFGLVFNLHIN